MNKIEIVSVPIEQLISAISECINSSLKDLKQTSQPQLPDIPDRPLNLKEAAAFLSVTVPTIYSMINSKELPSMKRRKLRYILMSDLVTYLKDGKSLSNLEIEEQANVYFKNKKRKGGYNGK